MSAIIEYTIFYFAYFLIVLIFVRAILTWFPEPRNPGALRSIYMAVISLSHVLTEPIISPIRKIIARSPLGGPGMIIDFSPILAFILIQVVSNLLIGLVRRFL